MSILLVLLTFFLIVVSGYLRRQKAQCAVARVEVRTSPGQTREDTFAIPPGYCFHPSHTWVVSEGQENARVGLDNLVTCLFGEINHIEVIGLERWVRQGQKLITVFGAGVSVDLLSPVEGVVKTVNQAALRNPTLVVSSPYRAGWIALIKSPEMVINLKNLLQDAMAEAWMRNNFARLNGLLTQALPALAQDGGTPLRGLLARVPPELRYELVQEFFPTVPLSRAQPVSTSS